MAAFLRVLAGIILLVAVIFAVNDATRSLADNEATAVTIRETWSAVSPSSLGKAQSAVERHTHPLVWGWGVLALLQLPTCMLFAMVGLILAYLGRRRRRVNVYAN